MPVFDYAGDASMERSHWKDLTRLQIRAAEAYKTVPLQFPLHDWASTRPTTVLQVWPDRDPQSYF